jgi:periplasmic divalent cation tolerance protein
MPTTALVALTTLGSVDEARVLVRALLDARVIACGSLLPSGVSIYRWKGEVREEQEVVVLLKTDASRWDALREAVQSRHPYEVPELLALPVERGLDGYLNWLANEVMV